MSEDATKAEVLYGEGRPESEATHPVVEQTQQAFDQAKVEAMAIKGQSPEASQSLYDTHREAFQKILDKIPPEQQKGINVKIANFWNKVSGRVDDVSSRVFDAIADYSPLRWAYRGIGKLRGVEVPTGRYAEMRKAKVIGAAEIQSTKMKQNIEGKEAFKNIVPGGKVLNIVDRIFGPKFK